MNVATAATPSSPLKTNITMTINAKNANATSSGKMQKLTNSSSQPITSGEPSALVCVFCGAELDERETYCCSSCETEMLDDPNYKMCGGDDG